MICVLKNVNKLKMLTIKNYNKLYRKDVGEYRVAKIQETLNSYIIQLNKPDGYKRQVMLERNPIGKQREYELWMWDTNAQSKNGIPTSTSTPKRIMLKIEYITDIQKLIGSIEFLNK
jgi:hypothetical protein